MTEPTRDDLLTSREAAALLRVPLRSLYAWRASGTGPPAYRVGKQTLYRRREIEMWLEKRREPAVA